jgi:5-methylthioadenosine/S-adenosylhomocysteine deaminase
MITAVRADHLVTGAGPVYSPGWLVIDGDRIVAVGRGDSPTGVETTDFERGAIVIPGLVSAHTHLPLGGFRGCADDLPFLDWIMKGLMPAIREAGSDPDTYARGARASAQELLRGGVTLVGDNFFRDEGSPALEATGQRGVFFQEVFGSTAEDEDAHWGEFEETVARLAARPRAHPFGYSPHTPWTCPPRTFGRVVERARAEGRRLSFHLAESREEHELFTAGSGPLADYYRSLGKLDRYRTGMTPTAYVAGIGALGPKTVVAHAVHATPEDLGILARTGTGVVHCPRSNMKLAEGIAPVPAMLDAGITVALGVDSAASSSRLDLFEEMRAALHAGRAARGAVGRMTAATVLGMATRNGAEVLGLGDVTGSLAAGKLADFVVLDASPARHRPVRDPVATVVHTCGPEDVASVVIGGVVRHRRGT